MYSDVLIHMGKLGMKWHVHRAKGYESSYTGPKTRKVASSKPNSAKEAHRTKPMSDEELAGKVKRMNLESQYKKLEKQKKLVDKTSDHVNQMSKINKDSIRENRTSREKLDLSNMTDKELRDRINRTNLERQYNDMFAKETTQVSKGRKFTTNLLDGLGGTLAIGSSALGIALAIKELRG